MNQQVARPASSPSAPRRAPDALAALDPLLEQELVWACRIVGDPARGGPRMDIVAALGAHDPDAFWAACDRRSAELAHQYGVEILLAQEDAAREVRIRVEPFTPAEPWVEGATPATAAAPPAARPRWPALRHWWRRHGDWALGRR
jgi:hypothetical protein